MYEMTQEDYEKITAIREKQRKQANKAWTTSVVTVLIPGVNVVAWANAHNKERAVRDAVDPDEWYWDENGQIQRR